MKSYEIKEIFLKFFEKKGHTIVQPSSLIPEDDQSILFTNSGMVQFKKIFTGEESRTYKSAVSCQPCLRIGGKHNDLENVGYTTRHHTFFEMLGNFSFGDYFKERAIEYAWELLTEIYKINPDKLFITVHKHDKQSFLIWKKNIGIKNNKIIKIGDQDNFWQMSDSGPCGPCSEIFYDHGNKISGGLPGSDDQNGDRFVEIWNLVFMQFNRDINGILEPLPQVSVDTGMGLERITAVLQGVVSSYETDLFIEIIKLIKDSITVNTVDKIGFKVIADHIRSISFLISSGILPKNDGRGYVLKRLIRRALHHAYKLGQVKPFLSLLTKNFCISMKQHYPLLMVYIDKIEEIIFNEEERFYRTFNNGLILLNKSLNNSNNTKSLDGKKIFSLYDTHGIPLDVISDICSEHSIQMDIDGFNLIMKSQKERARATSKFNNDSENIPYFGQPTQFIGYELMSFEESCLLKIYINKNQCTSISCGQEAILILDKTPFYPESGGQIYDTGMLIGQHGRFIVNNTIKIKSNVIGHFGKVIDGIIRSGEILFSSIDLDRRLKISRNHSATHLMHRALMDVLGSSAQQRGSLVDDMKIRFDFAYDKVVTEEQINQIEVLVNEQIFENHVTVSKQLQYEEALEIGAIALFSDKYDKEVRVLEIGNSCELCVGTHVKNTGEIGLFKVISQSSVAACVRRIEAITSLCAFDFVQNQTKLLHQLEMILSVRQENIIKTVNNILEKNKNFELIQRENNKNTIYNLSRYLIEKASSENNSTTLIVEKIQNFSRENLKKLIDEIKRPLNSNLVIVIACVSEDNSIGIIGYSNLNLEKKIHMGELISFISNRLGGKGGGRINIGNGIGLSNYVGSLSHVLNESREWIKKKLSQHTL